MSRKLTSANALENLKREAKRWLKALRDNADDARARLERALPEAPPIPTLRDVQHALARELGFSGWQAVRERIASGAPAIDDREQLLRRFLDNACPDHHVRGARDHVRAEHTAMRLLVQHPELADATFSASVVTGNASAVARALADRPELANAKDSTPSEERAGSGDSGDLMHKELGAKGWEPLLYLAFTRLPLPAVSENAVSLARSLLDAGADPNAFFMAGSSKYTPLVGVIGEGEENRPPHPQRDALVRLLLERGAEPYDIQVAYNIHFHGDVLWFLELAYERAVQLGRGADWDNPEWPMFDMGNYGSGARWHLWIAIDHDDIALAEWCLAHGANANAAAARSRHLPQRSLYEEAVRRGQTDMAALLAKYGAVVADVRLTPAEVFAAACARMDLPVVASMIARDATLLDDPQPLFEAARRNRSDVVAMLLDLGMSPNVTNDKNERALHMAAYENSVMAAEQLIARGAEIDPVEKKWDNTPLAAAAYGQHREMIDLLARYSRDIWELTYSGKVERVRKLLAERPELGRIAGRGHTPLMWLPPDDERHAVELARLFLSYGADATPRNAEGMTAADRADRNGMSDLAALLRWAESHPAAAVAMSRFERMAERLLDAFRTGTPEAMAAHWADAGHQRNWQAMRRYVLLDLGRNADADDAAAELSMDEARWMVARAHGFDDWAGLVGFVEGQPMGARPLAAAPVELLSPREGRRRERNERTRDWDAALAALDSGRVSGIDGHGQIDDELLARISEMQHVTTLRLSGSAGVTAEGLSNLARMPQLRELDLSGCNVGDAALAVLRRLPALERVNLAWTRVSDVGVEQLSVCEQLERVDLAGTATGDGALAALQGKAKLAHVHTGSRVTNAGLPLLHGFPVFKEWGEGDVDLQLLSPTAYPNTLTLRGAFTDAGMPALVGLDGLFGLNVDDSSLGLSADALTPLGRLPHLGFLGFDATDESMAAIAALPMIRFLMCQDTTAGDDGFTALSRSASLEFIWGRRCHNLRTRGFTALSTMPSLRGLSVSCLNVDDAGLATLPRFRALRELMPMDIPDAGYVHIGRCTDLEALILMYCRETSDAATEHITGLQRLTRYFNSYTRITDRTPELLSGMESLERIELAACPGVTNAGIAALAKLRRLQELDLSGMQNVTRGALAAFGGGVRVGYSV